MADRAADASITIGADLGPMQSALNEAQTLVKTKMDGIASSAVSSLKGIAAAAAGAFAFKELVDFVSSVAETRAHLQDLAETTGTTVETLSKIAGVAKVNGTSLDDVSTALVKLTKGLSTGDEEGGKAANALKALGVDARNANGSLRDAGEIYLEVAKKLGEFEDGAGKTALALDLFGKTGAAQLPLLKDIAAAGELVAKTTVEQAEQAKEYEQNLKRLEIQLANNKKLIAGEMIPVANDFVIALMDMLKGTDGLTSELKALQADGSIKQFGRDVASVVAFVIDAFDGVIRVVKLVGNTIGGVAAASVAVVSGEWGQVSSILSDMDQQADAIMSKKLFSDRLKDQFAKSDAEAGKPKAERAKLDYRGTDVKPKTGRLEDTSKAEYAVAKAQFEAALALQKEYLKEAQEGYDYAYAHNLISIKEYYGDRIATEQAAIDVERQAKKAEIDATIKAQSTATTDRERLTLKAQEIKLTGELTVLTAQYAQVTVRETRAMTEAERQRADGLRNVQIASQINIGNSQVAMDRIALSTRKALRQESDADAIQEEKGFEDRLTAIQAQAIKDRIEIEKAGTNDPVKIATLNAQLEDLERQHQEKITELDSQATIERNKYAIQASESIQANFETFFNDLTDRTKKIGDTFKALFKNILTSINQTFAKKLSDQLLGSGTTGGGVLNDFMKQLFGGSGSGSKNAAPTANAAASADGTAITALGTAATSTTGAMEGLSSSGIGGMFKSTTDWIAKNILGIATEETKTTVGQTATTALVSLTQAAYAAAAALSSVQASGAASGSLSGAGSALKGFGGLFGGSGASPNTGTALASDSAVMADANAFSSMGVVPYLAEGTNFVPQDMLAMIHKGERVTPAKYNNDDAGQRNYITQHNSFPAAMTRASVDQQAGAVALRTSGALRRNR